MFCKVKLNKIKKINIKNSQLLVVAIVKYNQVQNMHGF